MKLSTAQSIPIDVYVLILDYLSLADLGSFQAAYSTEPQMSQIAKWKSMLRLCELFTKGKIQVLPTIDGDRLYYKQFRDQPFRQNWLRGQCAATRPFRPFTASNTFERTFTGTENAAKMVLTPEEGQDFNSRYAPIDNTGAPGEVVRVEVSFTLRGEIIHLEYDTEAITVHAGVTMVYSEDGEQLTRTLRHRVPLIKATCRRVEEKMGHALPKDWVEFLGMNVFVRAVFVEPVDNRVSRFWNVTATMQSFELSWNIKLLERCCSADIIDLWRGKPIMQCKSSSEDTLV
jgi:hypothetical protein